MKIGNALLLAGVSVLAIPHLAYAQTGSASSQEASSDLGEIIVTARRASESLQKVPVAVTAVTGASLEAMNVSDITAGTQIAPNLSLLATPANPASASIFIRGIGNSDSAGVIEQGVGVYLDGVYLARATASVFDLFEIEQLEVLRGPQGTLFGRNSVGGALQIITKKPSDEAQAVLKLGYGSFSEWYARARVDTGQIGNSPFSAAISYSHRQRDGFTDNLLAADKHDPGANNYDAIAVALRGDFGDLTLDYSFDYNDRRATSNYLQTVVATPAYLEYFGKSESFGGNPLVVSPDRLKNGYQAGYPDGSGDIRFGGRAKISGHNLTLNYDVSPDVTIKAISAYRRFRQGVTLALGGNGNLRGEIVDFSNGLPAIVVGNVTPFNGRNAPQKQHQYSQEIQLLGKSGDFSYVAGAFYFREVSSERLEQQLTVPLPRSMFGLPGEGLVGMNVSAPSAFRGTVKSLAGFGQVSWKPASLDAKLELTGGLRYTNDLKTIIPDLNASPQLHGRRRFENVSWLASASYQFTDQIMGYLRVSTGFRSGGFTPRVPIIAGFDPEKAIGYEAGVKARFGDFLRANLAVYQTDYKDLQINQFVAGSGGATSVYTNAGKVTYRGAELEVTAMLADGLTLDGAFGYVDPNFKEYLYRDPVTDTTVNIASSAVLAQQSKFNMRIGGQYSHDLGDMNAGLRVDYSYRSRVYFHASSVTNAFNRQISSDPDHNLQARFSLSAIPLGGTLAEVGVWGDNLTNQRNIDFGIDFSGLGFGGASYKKPRSFGVDFKVQF